MSGYNFPPGAPCWIELLTRDLAGAQTFYGQLFGWSFEPSGDLEIDGYLTATKDGLKVAGLMGSEPDHHYRDAWSTYLLADDICAIADKAQQYGGQVYLPPVEVPKQGQMAMIGDPTGLGVGLWQPAGHHGYQTSGTLGTAVWHELHTRKFASSTAFYRQALGWELEVMSDTDQFRYQTLGAGTQARAGIMDISQFADPSLASWKVYFAVTDVDQIVAEAIAAGGAQVSAAMDSDFGRVAVLADPTGAEFYVIQASD